MKLQQVLIQGYRENLDFDVGIVASISNLVVVPSSDFVNSVSVELEPDRCYCIG
jgi:hypothetical protein